MDITKLTQMIIVAVTPIKEIYNILPDNHQLSLKQQDSLLIEPHQSPQKHHNHHNLCQDNHQLSQKH